jgi:sec-independent protein translocase protein TatA
MFGLGGQELILILFVVLLFFGPQKLPELMRGLGKGMREFKRAQEDLENEFNKAVETPRPVKEPVEPAVSIKEQESSAGSENKS